MCFSQSLFIFNLSVRRKYIAERLSPSKGFFLSFFFSLKRRTRHAMAADVYLPRPPPTPEIMSLASIWLMKWKQFEAKRKVPAGDSRCGHRSPLDSLPLGRPEGDFKARLKLMLACQFHAIFTSITAFWARRAKGFHFHQRLLGFLSCACRCMKLCSRKSEAVERGKRLHFNFSSPRAFFAPCHKRKLRGGLRRLFFWGMPASLRHPSRWKRMKREV